MRRITIYRRVLPALGVGILLFSLFAGYFMLHTGETKNQQQEEISSAPDETPLPTAKAKEFIASVKAATITPTPTPTTFQTEAWIYPGSPACNAMNEIKTRNIHTLKAEYLTLEETGKLRAVTETDDGCNGYSATNLALLKQYSKEQYATISAGYDAIASMIHNTTLRNTFVQQAVSFVNKNGMTGVDIDFEQFGSWTSNDYYAFKCVMKLLGDKLHSYRKKLQIDLPPIGNTTMQSYYVLKYQDFNTLPVDQYTIMAYDYQFDYGAGAPVQPISWMNSVITWAKNKFTHDEKISVGIPAYGYKGACDQYNISILTYSQAKSASGFLNAKRDSDSQEMMWRSNGYCYSYSDTTTLNKKIAAVKARGITSVSVWHLGGNPWFSN